VAGQAQAQGRLSLGDTLEDSANVALTSVLHAAPCATRHLQRQQHYLGHASLPWASEDRLVSVACKVSTCSGLQCQQHPPRASMWPPAAPFINCSPLQAASGLSLLLALLPACLPACLQLCNATLDELPLDLRAQLHASWHGTMPLLPAAARISGGKLQLCFSYLP
jgi:hypothetical protein